MRLICGPCALKADLKLADRIAFARLRIRDVKYNCDDCGQEHTWTFSRKSEVVSENISEEVLIQTSLF